MSLLRKLAAMAVAVVAAAAIAVPAFAVGPYSITIDNAATGHAYEAYQIFAGELSDGKLVDIKWGSGVSADGQEKLGDAATKAKEIAPAADAKAFAKEVAPYLTGAVESSVVNGKYVVSGLETGYYLIKDKDDSLDDYANDSYTAYIVQVLGGNVTVEPKDGVSTVQKKVKDVNDSTGASAWGDSADYDMGDSVPFQLTATLANNVSSYPSYKIELHDTLSAGLTYNKDARIYAGNAKADVTSQFDIVYEDNALTFTCNDVKKIQGVGDGSAITVEYTAELNSNAAVGAAGNPNTVYMEYSNNPTWAPDYNDDGGVANPEESPTGETVEDKVIVFTYKVVVNKVNEAGDALKGAGFTLYKKSADGNYAAIGSEVKGADLTTFEWKGVDDGDYKLVETTVPAGYNKMADIEFIVSATHEVESDNPQLTALSGGDLGTGNVQTGVIERNVINKAGVSLPTTGGMGTTVIYALGAILVLGAGIALVVKRRTSASK